MSAAGEGDLASAPAVPGIEPPETYFVEPPDNLGFELDAAIDCGDVIVPEFYRRPSDQTLKIGFMRFSARQEGTTYLALLGATLQSCVDDLEAQGVNFDAYNSVEIAADVNPEPQALGYDHIVYYGASYGAQLGQLI